MSDIPKSKRAYSNLEAHHKALDIRRMIAAELLASFAYSEKKLEAAIQDPERKAEVAQAIRSLEEDFSGYYANTPHDKCLEVLQTFLEREVEDPETLAGKIDPMLNYGVDPALLTGEKTLRKGVDIGSQPSQNIVYPYRLDNYAKIVKAVKGYGRYTDDSYAIARTREELLEKEAKEYGLIINRKKTRIVKLSSEFRHLQVCYSLTETGGIIRNITRERRKLKAYKRLLDSGRIDYATVENAFKSLEVYVA